MEPKTFSSLCKSLNKLGTNEVLMWTIFLNDCLDNKVGKDRILGMINILLEQAQQGTTKAQKEPRE